MPIRTAIVRVSDPRRDRDGVLEAARVLRQGGLVALPTETVYGMAANALDERAVARIFEAKGRPQDNPLIVHIARIGDLEELAAEIPPAALRLAERFWPGPLTMILPKTDAVPEIVSAGLSTVAVRMPSHPVAAAIIAESGVPLAAPSANLSGLPSPTTAQHCIRDLDGRVELIVDGGPCAVGLESTVLTLAEEPPRLLRPGAVTPEQLREVLGELAVDRAVLDKMEDCETAISPGMKYKHYSPKARVVLVHGGRDAFAAFLERYRNEEGIWALAFTGDLEALPVPALGYGEEHRADEQAVRLFAALRELDERGARLVYARSPSRDGVGLAVYNRLIRSAGYEEIYLPDMT